MRQTVIDTEKPIAPDALYTVSQIISRELEGMRDGSAPREDSPGWPAARSGEMRELLGLLAAQPPEKDGGVGSLVVGGRSNLLSFPEYADVDRSEGAAQRAWKRGKRSSPCSPIRGRWKSPFVSARKTGMEETKDCSIVTASYRSKRRNGQHDRPDRTDPDAIRQGACRCCGEVGQLDHGAAGRAE